MAAAVKVEGLDHAGGGGVEEVLGAAHGGEVVVVTRVLGNLE